MLLKPNQKGGELFKEPNYNKSPREAQELKKEGPPLCRRIKEKNEITKEEKKEKQEIKKK
jgi:hypothetical protein